MSEIVKRVEHFFSRPVDLSMESPNAPGYARDLCPAKAIGQSSLRVGVKKRRIYDVMNVLESIQVVERRAQDWYTWKGATSIKDALDALVVGLAPYFL